MKKEKYSNNNINIEYLLNEVKRLKNIELKYNALLNSIPYMAWYTDIDSNYIDVNNEFLFHCGKSIDDVHGKSHEFVWQENESNKCRFHDQEVIRKKERIVSEKVVTGKKGYRKYHIYRSPVIDENKDVIGIVGVGKDITELKNRDMQIQTLIESIPFEVWVYDKKGTLINANSKYASFKNRRVENLIGKNIREIFNGDESDRILWENEKIINEKKAIKFEQEITESNIRRSVEIYKSPIFDIANEVIGIVGILVDLTEIKDAKEKIKKQAYTDAQTGLLNRRALYEFLDDRHYDSLMSMLLIDVDNFKFINDTYGHQEGDRVLVYISNLLKEICIDEFIFRFGGDEFIIKFKPGTDKKTVEKKAQEILQKISKLKVNKESNEFLQVSIGVASCKCKKGQCRDGYYKLINKADLALYKAKSMGKNRYAIYNKELEEELNFEVNLVKDLKSAILNKEIELSYQPLYNMESKLIGFEALFRFNNKKYKDISIIEVVKVMEKNNLIISIGNEIIKKACLFAKKVNEDGEGKIITYINVSSIQIMDDDFIKNIKDIIEEAKVDSSLIGIEITETVLLENINENIEKLKQLKDLGISISLDDFGTGYTSLNYLVRLPLSNIKIDKSFIKGINLGQEYINIIKLIVDSSHSLNLNTIAEGVETKDQLELLRSMDIDYVQGYLFSKPLKEDDVFRFIFERQ